MAGALVGRERLLYDDLLRRTGAVVLSSSRGGEVSFESDASANGYFTESSAALTTPVADTDADGSVSADELRIYVSRAVAARSGDRQHPTTDRDNEHVTAAGPPGERRGRPGSDARPARQGAPEGGRASGAASPRPR